MHDLFRTCAQLVDSFNSIVMGPVLVTLAFLPLMSASKRKVIVNIGSHLGSFGLDRGESFTSYSITKVALNMMTYKLAKERADLICFVLAPGRVKTDMGGPDATYEPEFAISHLLRVIRASTEKDSGKFFAWDGSILPW